MIPQMEDALGKFEKQAREVARLLEQQIDIDRAAPAASRVEAMRSRKSKGGNGLDL